MYLKEEKVVNHHIQGLDKILSVNIDGNEIIVYCLIDLDHPVVTTVEFKIVDINTEIHNIEEQDIYLGTATRGTIVKHIFYTETYSLNWDRLKNNENLKEGPLKDVAAWGRRGAGIPTEEDLKLINGKESI